MPSLPPLLGHRGAAGHAPENTLASLRKAADLGARWVEFDLKLTADGRLVLFHDETLGRTTDGKGLVAEKTYSEIARLDAGSWFAPSFAGERVPTFEEAIEVLAASSLGANLEIKPCPGREAETGAAVARATRRLWPGHLPPPILSSFDVESLEAARDAAPDVARGLLLSRLRRRWIATYEALGCSTIHVAERALDAGAIASIRATLPAAPLLSFTVNEPARAATLFGLGVDALFTDFPDRLAPLVST